MDLKIQLHTLVLASRASQYIIFFDEIFMARQENEIFDIFRKYNIKREKYDKQLELLEKRFPNYPKEISYLKEIYQKYEQCYGKKDITTTNNIKKCEKIVGDILKNECSIEEYCANTGILISKIKLSINNTKIYEEHYDELNKRSKNFEQLIKTLIYGVLYEDMDIVDYFIQTNLDLNDFFRISKEFLKSSSDIIKISQFVKKNLTLMRMSFANKEQELKKATSINGREITIEEKEKVFTFIEQNDLPSKLYHLVLRKYLNGDLDLEQKKKIKRER